MPLPPPPALAVKVLLDNTSDSKLCDGICIQPALKVGQIDVSCKFWMMHRRTMSPQTHYGRPQQHKANPTCKPKQAMTVIHTPFVCQHGSQLLVHCGSRWTMPPLAENTRGEKQAFSPSHHKPASSTGNTAPGQR